MAINEGHLEARGRRGVDRGDRQDTAGRIVVVGERRDQHGPALGQDGRVVFGDGGQGRGLDDLDADDPQRRGDTVGDRVGEGIGARGRGDEVDGTAIQVRGDGRARGRTGHGGQRQRIAVGIRVVVQRIKRDELSGMGLVEVAVGSRRQVACLLDVDDELAATLPALVVGDGQDNGLRAGRSAFLGDGQRAVLRERHAQVVGGFGVLQVDRIPVGVTPVG